MVLDKPNLELNGVACRKIVQDDSYSRTQKDDYDQIIEETYELAINRISG